MKPLPFQLDASRSTSLTEQVANGLRKAILTGYYQAGEVLPTLLRMAELLGVSSIVTRGAIKLLAEEGLVNPRPRVGIVVVEPTARPWRTQVLYLTMSGPDMYYHNLLVGALSEGLLAERILFESMHISWRERSSGFPKVTTTLGASQIGLAVVEGDAPDACHLLHARGVPFLHLIGLPEQANSLAAGGILHDNLSAYKLAAAHAQAYGVRSAWMLGNRGQERLGRNLFAACGIEVTCAAVTPVPDVPSPMCVELGGLALMEEWLGQKALPELLVFTDDFVARGALLALTRRGLRIPEDVQVISWANRGLGPVYFQPLTRIEADGARDGQRIADFLLQFLRRPRQPPPPLQLAAEFIVGDSTRPGQS